MKNTTISMITAAAIAGLFGGIATLQAGEIVPVTGQIAATAEASSVRNTTPTRTLSDLAGSKARDMDTTAGKHDCKGENSCKGQGGCKSSDNGCKGKNSCKGKGGCNTSDGGAA